MGFEAHSGLSVFRGTISAIQSETSSLEVGSDSEVTGTLRQSSNLSYIASLKTQFMGSSELTTTRNTLPGEVTTHLGHSLLSVSSSEHLYFTTLLNAHFSVGSHVRATV